MPSPRPNESLLRSDHIQNAPIATTMVVIIIATNSRRSLLAGIDLALYRFQGSSSPKLIFRWLVGRVSGLTDMMFRLFGSKFIPIRPNEQTSDVDAPWRLVWPRSSLNAATWLGSRHGWHLQAIKHRVLLRLTFAPLERFSSMPLL
jgi:hypothetical protein